MEDIIFMQDGHIITKEQQIAFSYALQDIKNGHITLWVNRLKKEYPELYKYAIKKLEI